MEVLDTIFEDVKIIDPMRFIDNRGYFKETYHIKKHVDAKVWMNWAQDAISYSSKANTLRGLHYQPYMAKLVQVLRGSVCDVIVDIRPDSPTYKKWQRFDLSENNHHQLLIPAGFLHGFLTLTDDVIFSYKMSELYNAETEIGVNYKTCELDIDWPLKGDVIISEKDKNASYDLPGKYP